jgi:hypothetical protein
MDRVKAPKVVVEFETGNAAFREPDGSLNRFEVADALMSLAERVRDGKFKNGTMLDPNGNRVRMRVEAVEELRHTPKA